MSHLTRDITQISRCSNQFRNDFLASIDLKSSHSSYLTQIIRTPGISQDKLAKLIYIDKSNVARQAAVLEEKGYITRVPSKEDKRVMQLFPTQKALDVLPRIYEMYQTWSQLVTQDLTEEETVQLSLLLEKIKVRATEWMEAR